MFSTQCELYKAQQKGTYKMNKTTEYGILKSLIFGNGW